MAYVTEGRAGLGRLLRRFVLWRVGLRWYLFVLVGIPAIMFTGAIVVPGALASFHPLDPLPTLFSYLPFFVVVMVFGGPLLEEPGWRGFALPRMQRLHGPLVGSLILGALWGLWHLAPVLLSVLGYAQRQRPGRRFVCHHGYRYRHCPHVGFQQYEGKPDTRYLSAYLYRRVWGCDPV
jgi:membrane protease YdiL (CAAX protease family)